MELIQVILAEKSEDNNFKITYILHHLDSESEHNLPLDIVEVLRYFCILHVLNIFIVGMFQKTTNIFFFLFL